MISESPAERMRSTCKKLMVDVKWDGRGGQKKLSDSLNIDYASLNHALNGNRTGQSYLNILDKVYWYLLKLKSSL